MELNSAVLVNCLIWTFKGFTMINLSYKELKRQCDSRSKKILDALEYTLDLYKITGKRTLMANTILRFCYIKNKMVPTDDESKKLFQMTETFLSKCE